MIINKLKQLIPGNPGTSFVVALLYAIQHKYNENVQNEDQLSLFAKGIVNSRNVFFSGIINEISLHFNKEIIFLSNSSFILKLAKPELNTSLTKTKFSKLDKSTIDNLIEDYGYIVFSVDIYQFKQYHDYHFVCMTKENGLYKVYEPKTGKEFEFDEVKIIELINSITTGLKDILMCFVV